MLPVDQLLAVAELRRRELEERAAHARLARLAAAGRPGLATILRCRVRRLTAAIRRPVRAVLHRPLADQRPACGRCCPSPA